MWRLGFPFVMYYNGKMRGGYERFATAMLKLENP
jgi:hypothetical protein